MSPKPSAALDAALQRLVFDARASWADFSIDTGAFVAFVGERLAQGVDPVVALSKLHAADLYLAYACSIGNAKALRAFADRYLGRVPAYLHRIELPRGGAEEVRQSLEERLFAGDGKSPPAIATYAGRGALDGWVRVAAVRTALNLARSQTRRRAHEERAGDVAALVLDPELEILRHKHRESFEACFAAALRALPETDRRVLRLRYLEGLGAAEVAQVCGVHRATLSRWVASACEALFSDTRARLCDELGIADADCDSLIALVKSRLDVSLSGLLARAPDPD